MSILDTFFILFDSDASKLDKGLHESDKKAEGLLDKLKKLDVTAGSTGSKFVDMVGKLAGVAGVGLSIGALVHSVKETAAQYKALELLALQFRDTVEAVDEFRDASGLLGISEEKSTESLRSLNTAIQDTFLGMGRAAKVFEELHINVKKSDGTIKGTTAVMGELAEKFKTMDKGTQVRVMERLGLDPALLRLFNSDLGALQRRMEDVDRATGFNLQTAVRRASEYTKASKELGIEVNTLKMYLSKLSESFKIAALPWFTSAIKTATEYAGKFVAFLMRHSHFVEGFMIAAGAAISYYLIPAAIRGAIAVWAMIAPFALIALAVAAAATVFALLYDDIANFLEGNDSLIGQIAAKYPAVGDAVRELAGAYKFVYDVARALFGFLIGMWDSPSEAFATFKADITEGLNALFALFPGLGEGFAQIMGVVKVAGSAIVDVWDAIVAAVRLAMGVLDAGIRLVAGLADRLGFNAQAMSKPGAAPAGAQAPAAAYPDAQSRRAAQPYAVPVPASLPPATRAAVAAGQAQMTAASSSPLTATTSSVINNGGARRGGDRNVTIGKVEVQTQATDAEGISQSIGTTLGTHMRNAASQYDDGVAA